MGSGRYRSFRWKKAQHIIMNIRQTVLVQESKHGNVTPQAQWCQIEMQKRIFDGHVQIVNESSLESVQRRKGSCCGVIDTSCHGFKNTEYVRLVLQDHVMNAIVWPRS